MLSGHRFTLLLAVTTLMRLHKSVLSSYGDASTMTDNGTAVVTDLPPPPLTDPRLPSTDDFIFTDNATRDIENKTLQYLLATDLLYCPKERLCQYNRSFIPFHHFKFFSLFSCCEPCSCDTNCHTLETCCPDVIYPDVAIQSDDQNSSTDNRLSCIAPNFLPFGKSEVHAYHQVVMVSRCEGPMYITKNRNAKEQCEKENIEISDNALDYMVPVTVNGTTYKNKFCAMCYENDLTSLVKWTAEVICSSGVKVSGISISNLLENVLKERACNVLYSQKNIPNIKTPTECNNGLIRKCNMTGIWRTYDAFIERACESYTHIYRGIFRNIFCFICNSDDNEDMLMRCFSSDLVNPREAFATFTEIIQYNTPTNTDLDAYEEDTTCSSGHRYDMYQVRYDYNKRSMIYLFDSVFMYLQKIYVDLL